MPYDKSLLRAVHIPVISCLFDISLQRYSGVLTPPASFLIWRVLGSAPVRTITLSHIISVSGGEAYGGL